MPDPVQTPKSSAQVWGWIAAVIVGVLMISKCSEKPSTESAPSQFAAFPT